MKKTILFLFLLLIPFLCINPNVSAQKMFLPAAELKKILTDRTFSMTDMEESQQKRHVYFAPDGRYTVLFASGNIRTTDKWNITENNNLCLRRTFRSEGGSTYTTSCGLVSLDGPNAVNVYNEEGKLIKNLQFLGNGDLLEQFAR